MLVSAEFNLLMVVSGLHPRNRQFSRYSVFLLLWSSSRSSQGIWFCFDSLFEADLLVIFLPSILKLSINQWLNFQVSPDCPVGARTPIFVSAFALAQNP